jgi:heme oxygenase
MRSAPIALEVQPLSLALRAKTREVHERLERALPLTDPDLTVDAYRVVVEAFYGFYAPLEPRLAALATGSDGAVPRRDGKVSRLRADLRALGSSEMRVESLPLWACAPEEMTFARGMGCLYVVEGATLGGRVIVRALRDRLGIGPATGAAFFEAYGDQTGAMWRSFVTHLDSFPWPPAETAAAAMDTFLAFEYWLRAQGAAR